MIKKLQEINDSIKGIMLLKFLCLNFTVGFMPFFIMFAVFSFFDVEPVIVNGEPVYGLMGSMLWLFMGVIFGLFSGFMYWLVLSFGRIAVSFMIGIIERLKK